MSLQKLRGALSHRGDQGEGRRRRRGLYLSLPEGLSGRHQRLRLHRLAAAGRYEDSYRLIRRGNPFPSVCGRICTHNCQSECNRNNYDSSVAIRDIKRFVADKAFKMGIKLENVWPLNGKRVGIIGAGPSGLTAAYYLALSGYTVDVYDSAPVAGGVLAFGIPKWRLPKDVIEREVKAIEVVGVKIHLNTEIGRDKSFDELRSECDAIYIATGTQFSRRPRQGRTCPAGHGLTSCAT
ncbi:MAG: NAD(P)-binding protein [Oscillospiraceae bacterium]